MEKKHLISCVHTGNGQRGFITIAYLLHDNTAYYQITNSRRSAFPMTEEEANAHIVDLRRKYKKYKFTVEPIDEKKPEPPKAKRPHTATPTKSHLTCLYAKRPHTEEPCKSCLKHEPPLSHWKPGRPIRKGGKL